jgi:hypothetical protein
MNYRKPRCEYKNCEKESDVQTETKTEYRWYCADDIKRSCISVTIER